ncbi:hypothetical protein AVEN_137996-1 [Araneus ventricosus]|uniref:Uncharacterized protein n=1 Tax=Araneus ventricosus TaxID=182803 RepID=A0A4Y2KNK6_ARAVE|nr:hypothetical protein AVEN_137996-1 [Araneus ventricosus]
MIKFYITVLQGYFDVTFCNQTKTLRSSYISFSNRLVVAAASRFHFQIQQQLFIETGGSIRAIGSWVSAAIEILYDIKRSLALNGEKPLPKREANNAGSVRKTSAKFYNFVCRKKERRGDFHGMKMLQCENLKLSNGNAEGDKSPVKPFGFEIYSGERRICIRYRDAFFGNSVMVFRSS